MRLKKLLTCLVAMVFSIPTLFASSVTLNISGVPDAYKYVMAFDMYSDDGDLLDITGNSVVFNYNGATGLSINVSPEGTSLGYVIPRPTCDIPEGNGNYTIGSFGMGGDSWVISLYNCDGYTFNIEVVDPNAPEPEPEYSYVLSGPIFSNLETSLAMTLNEETGVWSATFAGQAQTFNIKKMNGEQEVAVIGAATDVNAANQLTYFGEYQALEGSGIDWVLSAVVCPHNGDTVTLEFNPETMTLNVPKQEVSYMAEGTMVAPASTLVTTRIGMVDIKWTNELEQVVNPITVTVTAPSVGTTTLNASFITPTTTDTGENFGYPYPVVDVNLGSLVSGINYAPYYGEWSFTIPAGVVKNPETGEVNPEQTFTLTWLKDNDEYTVAPAFGSSTDVPSYTAEELANVSITWDGATAVSRNEDVKGAELRPNGSAGSAIDIDGLAKAEGNALTFDFSNLDPGKYQLYIPDGYVFLTTANGTQVNYMISLGNCWFALTEGMSAGTVLAPFAAEDGYPTVTTGDEVAQIEYAGQQLSLTGTGTVKLYPDEWMEFTPVEIPASNVTVDGAILSINWVDGVVLTEDFLYSNTRVIVVPEGLVKNAEGAINPEQKIIFSVLATIDAEPEWTPASGSNIDPATENITLAWEGASWIDYPEKVATLTGEGVNVTLKKAEPNFGIAGEITIDGDDYSVVTFNFSGLNLADGTYTINVPVGAFTMEVDYTPLVCEALTYTFTVGEVAPAELPALTVEMAGIQLSTEQPVTVPASVNGMTVKCGDYTLTPVLVGEPDEWNPDGTQGAYYKIQVYCDPQGWCPLGVSEEFAFDPATGYVPFNNELIYEGAWQLTIPEGAFTVDGVPTSEIIFPFNVGIAASDLKAHVFSEAAYNPEQIIVIYGEVDGNLTPTAKPDYELVSIAEGATAQITVAGSEVAQNAPLSLISVVPKLNGPSLAAATANAVAINTSEIDWASGLATIVIPEGAVLFNDAPVGETTLTYDVLFAQMEPATLVEPASAYVTDINHIAVTWNYENITDVDGLEEKILLLTGLDSEWAVNVNIVEYDPDQQGGIAGMSADYNGNILTFDVPEFTNSAGIESTLDIVLPYNLVKLVDGDKVNPEQTIRLTVINTVAGDYTLTPADGIVTAEELEEISLSWNGLFKLVNPMEARVRLPKGEEFIYLSAEDYTLVPDQSNPGYYSALTVNLGKYLQGSGEYEFIINDNAFLVYDNDTNLIGYSPAIVGSWTIAAQLPEWTSVPANNAIIGYAVDSIDVEWSDSTLSLVNGGEGITVVLNDNGQNLFVGATILSRNPEGEEGDENYQENEDNLLTIFIDAMPGMTEDGTYVVTIPAGVVNILVDGEEVPNEAISFSYTVDINVLPKYYDGTITVDPACVNGSEAVVTALSTVTLDFGGNPVTVNDATEIFVVVDNDGIRQNLETSQVSVSEDGNLVLDLSAFVNGPGTYSVTIPEGVISIDINDVIYINGELIYTYVIEPTYMGEASAFDVTTNKPIRDYVAELQGNGILVSWDGQKIAPTAASDNLTVDLYIETQEGPVATKLAIVPFNFEAETDGPSTDANEGIALASIAVTPGNATGLSITYTEKWPFETMVEGVPYGYTGNMRFVIPAGLVQNAAGDINPAQTIEFGIAPITEIVPVITPAAENNQFAEPTVVESLDEITITWEGASDLEWSGLEVVTFRAPNAEGDVDSYDLVELGKASFDGSTLTLDVAEYTEAYGEYQLIMRSGSVVFNVGAELNMSQEIILNYVIENPAAGTLVFETPFVYNVAPANQDANVVAVPVSLDIDGTLEYQGFQFDVTLPAGLQVSGATLNEAIATEQGATIQVRQVDETNNVYRVIALLSLEGKGFNLLENIASFNVTVTEDSDIEEGLYDVTLSGIDFSTTMGQDVKFEDFQGQVDVRTEEIPVETLTFRGAELLFPSINNLWDYDEDPFYGVFTVGQELEITLEILPENYTTDVTVTSNVEGVTVTLDEQTGLWILESEGAEISEETHVTLTATANEGDDIVTASITLSIKPVLDGDANFNDEVTVADVVSTANYAAKLYDEIAIFDYPNGNVVDDDVINTDDVTAIVNIVLGVDNNKQNIRRQAVSIANNDRLVADSFRASKAQAALGVNLENSNAYSALQATVIVPEGMTVYGVTAGPRAAAHELVYNMVDGKVYVVLYSLTNASFAEGDGALFNILYTADSNCDELVIEAIHASDARSNGYDLQYEGGLNASATGIGAIEADIENGARYFDVNGYEVRNPEAGQILIRVKGNESTKVLVK